MNYLTTYFWKQAAGIRRRAKRTSNAQIDLMRLYGIFCVVYAHCCHTGFYLFHWGPKSSLYVIPLFIFCAGYFYKPETDGTPVGKFICQRAKAYLLPYFIWNFVYGIICSVLRGMGIITYGQGLGLRSFFLEPWMGAGQYFFNYAAWFLLTLFLVATVTWGVRKLLKTVRPIGVLGDHVLFLCFLLLGMIALILLGQDQQHGGVDVAILRPMLMLPFYQMGYVYKRYWAERISSVAGLLVMTVIVVVLCFAGARGLDAHTVYGQYAGNHVLMMGTILAMVLLVAFASDVLGTVVKGNVIKYASHCTMYIMLHHLFVLFVMNLVLYLVGVPGFDGEAFRTNPWYTCLIFGRWSRYAYIACGLVVPVLVHRVYDAVILRIGKEK